MDAMRIILVLAAAALSACVVFPTSRTYYEPNPDDGEPTPSQSCGYHRAADDGLTRKVEGLALSVFPRLDADEPLQISFLIGKTAKSVTVDAARVELRAGATTVAPVTIKENEPGPYFSKSITLTFPSSPDTLENIAVAFRAGFLKIGGIEINLAPFRFRKVTKGDLYYGSINC